MNHNDNAILYSRLFAKKRLAPSNSTADRSLLENISSDRARIVFSSPFRRMQQKAQVFSLETNAAVRSRLTHTLEVAHVGQQIAENIVNQIFDLKEHYDLSQAFIKIVENACFLHDIGNPPFGHFGEYAIQKWFKENRERILKNNSLPANEDNLNQFNDFIYFDGNPQGVRIAISLQEKPINKDDHNEMERDRAGFNLLYPQILSFVKYNHSASHHKENGQSKPGFFDSEREKIDRIRETIKFPHRFPLVYVMEAADDISYCLSDIEDGIEKRIITAKSFFEELTKVLGEESLAKFPTLLPKIRDEKGQEIKISKSHFFDFKTNFTIALIKHASEEYIKNHSKIVSGTAGELIDKSTTEGRLVHAIKDVSRRCLYNSWEAEKNELAGFKIIDGLLDTFKRLLFLNFEKTGQKGGFEQLVGFHTGSKIDFKGLDLDIERRLFNTLPEKYLMVYISNLEKVKKKYESNKEKFRLNELILRSHLITDYISGMTDIFALERYKVLYGISLA